MMRACVRLQMNGQAAMFTKVLRPEAEALQIPALRGDASRSRMMVREENGTLVLDIEADDIVALRAAVNSYLRWTKLAIDTNQALEVLE